MAVYRITDSSARKAGRRLVREGKVVKHRVRKVHPSDLLTARIQERFPPIRGIAGAVFRAIFDFNRRKL